MSHDSFDHEIHSSSLSSEEAAQVVGILADLIVNYLDSPEWESLTSSRESAKGEQSND